MCAHKVLPEWADESLSASVHRSLSPSGSQIKETVQWNNFSSPWSMGMNITVCPKIEPAPKNLCSGITFVQTSETGKTKLWHLRMCTQKWLLLEAGCDFNSRAGPQTRKGPYGASSVSGSWPACGLHGWSSLYSYSTSCTFVFYAPLVHSFDHKKRSKQKG